MGAERGGEGGGWCQGTTLRRVEKVIIQGLATPESRRCDGRFSRTPDPVQSQEYDRGGGEVRIKTWERARSI